MQPRPAWPSGQISLIFVLALVLVHSVARAQTGAALLVQPWPDKSQLFDGHADAFFFDAGHVKRADDGFRLDEYESTGRFRILPGNEISPRIGYDVFFLDSHTGDPRIPRQLSDDAIAFGTGVFKHGDWVGGVTLGVGYAGDKPFGEGDGWYIKSDLIVAKQLNEHDHLVFALDFNGNRSYYPDLPLPGIAWSHRFDPTLDAVIGAPFSSVSWRPIPQLDLEAEYALLADLRAKLSYEFVPHFDVFGMFDYRREAFHVADLPRDRRLLFVQKRVEVGLEFKPREQMRISVGVGYGFDGQFRSGFDFDNSKRFEYFSDEPYLHGGLEIRF